MSDLNIYSFYEDAKVPTRQSAGACGFDLYAQQSVSVAPGTHALVGTGIGIALPVTEGETFMGKVEARSGLSVKYGIEVGAGVIDADYRGEIKVVLHNFGNNVFEVKKGDRIAQLLIHKCYIPNVTQIYTMDNTTRGVSGFGSTGV